MRLSIGAVTALLVATAVPSATLRAQERGDFGELDRPILEARTAVRAGDLDRAAATLEAMIAESPRGVYRAWHLLGQVRLLRGDAKAASIAYEEALRRAPGFGPARLGRVEASLVAGRFENAEADLRAVLEDGSPTPSLRRQAEVYLASLGDPEEAGRRLVLALDEDLGAGYVYAALGVLRWRRGERDGSAAALSAALALDERHGLARSVLAGVTGELPPLLPPVRDLADAVDRISTLVGSGALDEAGRLADEILRARPSHVPVRVLRSRGHALAGDLWAAAAGYEAALSVTGPVPSVAAALGRTALSMGAHDLAACVVELALELRPEDPAMHFLLATAEEGRGDLDLALEHARRALELGHEPARSWVAIGDLLFQQMEVSGSIEAYRRAVEIDPRAAESIRRFALASLTADESEALRSLLEAQVAAHPENLDTLYALASANLAEGDLDLAESRFRRFAELAPDRAQAHYSLGQVLLRKGRVDEGRAAMERFRALKAAEEREWERHNRAHFRRLEARDALEAGDAGRAVRLYRESVEDDTATRDDELALADALLQVGRAEESVDVYRRLLGRSPYDEQALGGLASAAVAAGRPELRDDAERKLGVLEWCSEV